MYDSIHIFYYQECSTVKQRTHYNFNWIFLQAYKNTVPVPRHWCFKRKYLAGKRGFLKNPFDLPEFIKVTLLAFGLFNPLSHGIFTVFDSTMH